MSEIRKIGILTSGGDAPGMNLTISTVARCAALRGVELLAIPNGYASLIGTEENLKKNITPLTMEEILNIEDMRGTYLRTARCDEFLNPEVRKNAAEMIRKVLGIDALIVIGGDGSFHGAVGLCENGIPCVGIPGTIDNDLAYTERTLGFSSAVSVCVEAVRSLRATSRSHCRSHVVEVMGRHCGDIATWTAKATGAEMLVVPEEDWSIAELAQRMKKLAAAGDTRSTLVLAEHSWDRMADFDWRTYLNDEFKKRNKKKAIHPQEELNSQHIAEILEFMTGIETRATVLGYVQRGPVCTPEDAIFAFESGRLAVDLICDNQVGETGKAIGIKDGKIFSMALTEALKAEKNHDGETYQLINRL